MHAEIHSLVISWAAHWNVAEAASTYLVPFHSQCSHPRREIILIPERGEMY